MNSAYYVSTYAKHFRELVERYGGVYAMEMIVGGQYDEVGKSEEQALRSLGLAPEHSVVDVGCGTGRLSTRLAPYLRGKFVGTDLLPELLEHARTRAGRPDWEFLQVTEPPLPVPDGSVDWVTFFSVFTHILDEHIYLYLQDAKRMLRPGGKIIFSYLDFDVPYHWRFFEGAVANQSPDRTLVRFLHHSTYAVWARHLGLTVEKVYSGDDKWVQPLPGAPAGELTAFGQSLAVLAKPPAG